VLSQMGNDSNNEYIIGFDILPSSSPESKRSPKFACAISYGGVIINEYPEITRGALLKLTRDISPKWLCTDNIFEIVPDSKSLFHLANRIPIETKIVQVTGVPPHQTPLKTLARRYGINVRGKPNPLESARIITQLAFKGVGHSIECFSEQTEIKISRGRKPGRGGQSANRYRRRIHSQIQQMTRFIESQLKTAEIQYDINLRTSDFGYSSARLVTNAPLPVIRNLVESKRGGDFKVTISPVRKRVEFVPLEPKSVSSIGKPRYYILGIDPGTTAAYCLLTFDGTVKTLRSGKGYTRADIIREIYEKGIPVMVASDVPQVPHFVEKIASTVNATIFTPPKPIPVADKQELAREFSESIRVRNAHERDALTAAVYAYRSVQSKIQQIDRMIRDEQLTIDRNQLIALVIKGTSINEALASLERVDSEVIESIPEEKPEPKEELTQERFDQLKSKVEQLTTDNTLLEEELDDSKRLVEYLRFRESELSHSIDIVNRENYWKVKRDREVEKSRIGSKKAQQEIEKLRSEIDGLRKHLDLLRGVKRLEIRGDMIAIKVIPHFTRESIEDYDRKTGLKHGDIILFEDASGGGIQTAGLLIEKEIRAVVVDTPLSHLPQDELIKALIPVIDAKDVELKRVDEFAFISRKKFEKVLQIFVKDVREQARQKGEEHLVELIERYRREIER
jgi:predicted RNase H-like nuclease (RuvC/YqgF family)